MFGFLSRMFSTTMSLSNRAFNYITTGKYTQNTGLAGVEEISTVYACFKLLSQSVSQMRMGLKDKDGKDYQDKLGWWRLLRTKPNNIQSWNDILSTTEYHRSKYGNAFWRKRHNKKTGQIESIQLLNPADMYNWKYDHKSDLVFYTFNITEPSSGAVIENVTLSSDEVVHFKAITDNGILGLAPLAAISINMGVFSKALQTTDNYYENGALGVQVLETLQVPKGSAVAKDIKEEAIELKDNYFGFRNTGSIIPLPPGTSIKNVSNNFKDADMIAMLHFNKKEFASVFSIPLYMLAEPELASNGVQQQSEAYLQNTINPILRIYADAMNANILNEEDQLNGVNFRFDTSDFVLEDLKTRSEAMKNLVGHGMATPRQAATKLGFRVDNPSKFLDLHYMQGQYSALELTEELETIKQQKADKVNPDNKAEKVKGNPDNEPVKKKEKEVKDD
jgi:HK97 family phage portal protein